MPPVTSHEWTLPDQLHMDELGLACFKARLAVSESYLEYGSGGSTVYATSVVSVSKIISVDSDGRWVEALRGRLAAGSARVHIEHCDIGEVGDWGIPKDESGIRNYWQYSISPWKITRAQNINPDLVLIDGRFRVACFLYSLLCARVGATILFDDYFDRPQYFLVEQYCDLAERAGRMGIFSVTKDFDPAELCSRVAEYSIRTE